jgi:hypothetical protein
MPAAAAARAIDAIGVRMPTPAASNSTGTGKWREFEVVARTLYRISHPPRASRS